MKIRTYMQWFFKVEGHLCNFLKLQGSFCKNAWAAGGGAAVTPRGKPRLAVADVMLTQA
jgi:hypothetical protein